MNLRETQALFWRAISWPTGIDDFLAQADEATRRAFETTFVSTDAFARPARMSVYAEAYFWRLFEVTADQFDVTAWIAGARRFHNFVTDYVLTHPSRGPDVRRFAADVPHALAEHALGQAVPGIEDVAAVQWAILRAVDGPDAPRLAPEHLARIPAPQWPQLRLQLDANVALVPCRADFSALHAAHDAGEAAPTELELTNPPRTILVWRQHNLDVYHRVLDPPQVRALAAVQHGGSFADVCDAAAGPLTQDATPADVVGWLHAWIRDGLLAAASVP